MMGCRFSLNGYLTMSRIFFEEERILPYLFKRAHLFVGTYSGYQRMASARW